jgi:hypothetical protein
MRLPVLVKPADDPAGRKGKPVSGHPVHAREADSNSAVNFAQHSAGHRVGGQRRRSPYDLSGGRGRANLTRLAGLYLAPVSVLWPRSRHDSPSLREGA